MSIQNKLLKVNGADNTFLISLEKAPFAGFSESKRSLWIRRVCSLRHGFGVDGILFLSKRSSTRFAWEFFNSDGSVAEMCGNAARCVGAIIDPAKGEQVHLETLSGEILIRRDELGLLQVGMRPVQVLKEELSISLSGETWKGQLLDTGVPHFVLPWDHEGPPSLDVSATLRRHLAMGPRGANVTWLLPSESETAAVTFERGVEDFTPACGTGAVAAAAVVSAGAGGFWTVRMPGGVLGVDLGGEVPWLSGPVEIVGEVIPKEEVP